MMRFRIGYGGPREYRHGQYFPGGRRNNGGLTEIERLIHLIASMQILFGSRRGGALIPIVIIGLAVGGWFLYRYNYSPEVALERAHQMWDSNDTKQQISAIKTYRKLLHKTDPLEAGRHWLTDDRDTLYRRVIRHDILFAEDEAKAAEWVLKAWDEGIRDLRFQDERVKEFWDKTTASSKQKNKNRDKNKANRFDSIPGIDPQSKILTSARFSLA